MLAGVSLPEYTISGKIRDKFNVPMSGLIVKAFDKGLRSELGTEKRIKE